MKKEEDIGYTEVYAWGADRFGQLGIGNKQTGRCYCIPRLCSFNTIIQTIACGEEHSAFITLSALVFTMGSNNEGRLGIGDKHIKQSSTPCLVDALSKSKAVSISCGWGHSAALMENGELFTWGVGEYGALGQPTMDSCWSPHQVEFGDKAKAIQTSCGTRHTTVVDELGQLKVFGSGDAGQLGTGMREKEPLPIVIKLPEKVSSSAAGIFHTLILTTTGKVYAMGGNNYGQLGLGNKRSLNIPTKVKEIENEVIVKVSAGNHSAVINNKGELFLWGTSAFGEYLLPTKVPFNSTVKDVCIGGCFGAMLTSDGDVYSWGQNTSGELGVGDYDPRSNPTKIQSLVGKSVTNLCCGGFYTIALGKINYRAKTPGKMEFSPQPDNSTSLKKELACKFESLQTMDKKSERTVQDQYSSLRKKEDAMYNEERNKRKTSEFNKYTPNSYKNKNEIIQILSEESKKGSANKEKQFEDLRRENGKQLQEIVTLKEENKSLESENKRLKEITIMYQKENTKYIDTKSGDNKKLRESLKEFEQKYEQEIDNKHNIINEKAKEINTLLDTINDLETTIVNKDMALEKKEKENANCINKLQSEYNAKVTELQKACNTIDLLKKEYNSMANEKLLKKEELSNKESKIAELKEDISKYICEYRELEKQNNSLSHEVQLVRDEMHSKELSNDMITEELKKLNSELTFVKESSNANISNLQVDNNNLRNEIDLLRSTINELEKKNSELQTHFNDKTFECEELTKKVNLRQNEIETMTKEIDAWKQMADKLGTEGDQLRRIIEDLEEKNKKLGETINTQLYNRAAEYKEKMLNTLKSSQSPSRIQNLLSSGKKLNYVQPSPLRLDNLIKEEKNKKQSEVEKMIQFQSSAHQNIKTVMESKPNHEALVTDFVVEKDKFKIETPNEDKNKLVNSNYEVINTLSELDDNKGIVKVSNESHKITTNDLYEEAKHMDYEEDEPQTEEMPIDEKIQKSAHKLMNLLGIESPIRSKIANEALSGKIVSNEGIIKLHPTDAKEESPPHAQDYSFRNTLGSPIADSLIKSSLNNVKETLSRVKGEKHQLEKDILDYEKQIAINQKTS